MSISQTAFIAHGSPMNVVADNEYTRDIIRYSHSVSKPKAVIIISAHWTTHETRITAHPNPEQIYDFYGFPKELHNVVYAPKGLPELAGEIHKNIPEIIPDNNRGIDHAGWAVAKLLFPEQDVPLLEISLNMNLSPEEHFQLAKKLRNFRDQGIFFVGSGNMIHNLGEVDFDDNAPVFPWAQKLNNIFKTKIEKDDIPDLINYKHQVPDYRRAIPTNEHYLPFLYILALKDEKESCHWLHDSIQNGSISMLSCEFK